MEGAAILGDSRPSEDTFEIQWWKNNKIWLVIRQRMTKCVFCVLCLFVFFFFKLEKSKKEYCMIFAMRLSLGSAWAYAILWFPPTERASDTQCVFVFLCFFLPKNTKTHWPNVSLSFFNIRIAPDSLCVFVFLCFFSEKYKNTLTKCFFVFF